MDSKHTTLGAIKKKGLFHGCSLVPFLIWSCLEKQDAQAKLDYQSFTCMTRHYLILSNLEEAWFKKSYK